MSVPAVVARGLAAAATALATYTEVSSQIKGAKRDAAELFRPSAKRAKFTAPTSRKRSGTFAARPTKRQRLLERNSEKRKSAPKKKRGFSTNDRRKAAIEKLRSRARRPRAGRSQPPKSSSLAPASNPSPVMPKYGQRRRRLNFGSKTRRRGRGRRGRGRKGRSRSARLGNVIRLFPKGRPMTKTIKLRHVQHVHINPAQSRWQYFKFYPSNLTNQILQSSINFENSESSFTPLWMKSAGGQFRKWMDLYAYQNVADSATYNSPDVKHYGRHNGTTIDLADLDDPAAVRSATTISSYSDLKKRPYGFNEWVGTPGANGEYGSYTVLGAKLTMEHVPTVMSTSGSVMYMGFTKQDHINHTLHDLTENVASSEVTKFMNQANVKSWKLFSSGTVGTKVSGFYSRKKAYKQLRKAGLADDTEFAGSASNPPDRNAAVNFVIATPGQGDPGDQTFLLTTEYIIRCSKYTPTVSSNAV